MFPIIIDNINIELLLKYTYIMPFMLFVSYTDYNTRTLLKVGTTAIASDDWWFEWIKKNVVQCFLLTVFRMISDVNIKLDRKGSPNVVHRSGNYTASSKQMTLSNTSNSTT